MFSDEVDGWVWKSVDEKETVSLKGPMELGNQQWKQFISSYDMCLTGTFLPLKGCNLQVHFYHSRGVSYRYIFTTQGVYLTGTY